MFQSGLQFLELIRKRYIFLLTMRMLNIIPNCIYRQVVGIPMGTSCAPHKANIYFHQYEESPSFHICQITVSRLLITT